MVRRRTDLPPIARGPSLMEAAIIPGPPAHAADRARGDAERYALAGGDPALGLAYAERGDVLRLIGEHAAAEQAYDEAVRFGNQAQPGRALLWSAEGRVQPAAAAVRRALDVTGDPVHRSQLLPAAVEVLLAVGADEDAAALAVELAGIAESFGCAAPRAAAAAFAYEHRLV